MHICQEGENQENTRKSFKTGWNNADSIIIAELKKDIIY